jgi:hypothetical protein
MPYVDEQAQVYIRRIALQSFRLEGRNVKGRLKSNQMSVAPIASKTRVASPIPNIESDLLK